MAAIKKTKPATAVVEISETAATLLSTFVNSLLAFHASMDAKVITGQKKAEKKCEADFDKVINYIHSLEKKNVDPTFDRAGFEIWAESENYSLEPASEISKRKDGYYENASQAAWEGWRAAKGYVAPEIKVPKLVITVEHEEEGDGGWENDMFSIMINGKNFAYGNLFLENKIPFNWDIFSTTATVAGFVAKSIDFKDLNKANTPKQAIKLITKQVKAWVKTPQGKKVLEHFLKWNENGSFATRLRS